MKSLLGELIGTYILVLLGCGSVAWAVLIEPLSLFSIAVVWCMAVILGILASRPFSQSHLNPAVTCAFLLLGSLKGKELHLYLIGQFTGAFAAATSILFIFEPFLDSKTIYTAMIFGEYYPNPGNMNLTELSLTKAMMAEGIGTFLLMLGILLIIKIKGKYVRRIHPVLIGVLLMSLIYVIAPYTQAGFNPARDFAPRLLSYLAGWRMAFQFNGQGWWLVYMFAPILGALLASLLFLRQKKTAKVNNP